MKITGPKPATLTGLAVGDALGMPFEMKASLSQALLEWKGFFEPSLSSVNPDLKAGQWTDDTKMARALGESLLASGTYSPADAADRYLAWFESKDFRGSGATTMKALSRLQRGLPWTQSGIAGSEGNGTAMRAAPLGLTFWRNIQAASEMARIDAQITHKSEEAELGSVAVAVGVALLVEGRIAKEDLILKVLEWLPGKSQMAAQLQAAHHLAPRGRRVDRAGNDRSFIEALVTFGTGAHVVQTVPAAFCAFVGSESFQDAVEVAIRAGGDTDTTGAIVGALAGTYYGIEQVARYADKVEDGEAIRDLEMKLIANAKTVTGPR